MKKEKTLQEVKTEIENLEEKKRSLQNIVKCSSLSLLF